MNFGLYAPNFGPNFGDPEQLAIFAEIAEESGWDGFFLWDHLWHEENPKIVDPWVALSVMAYNTSELKLGTTVTPLPRRSPFKLAREIISIDHLSKGRFILGIGLGTKEENAHFGLETDYKKLGQKSDEVLEILLDLLSGKEINYEGKYFDVKEVKLAPKTIQENVKIWGGGTWPNKGPFKRVAQLPNMGIIPLKVGFEALEPEEFKDLIAYVKDIRGENSSFDVVKIGFLPGENPEEDLDTIERFNNAGVNWWLEAIGDWRGNYEEIKDFIEQGPPFLD